jgi:dextranase
MQTEGTTMPRVLDVLPNQSTYRPGQSAEIVIAACNAGEEFIGTLVIELVHLDETLATRRMPVTFEAASAVERTATFALPLEPGRGYGIDVSLFDRDGTLVDRAGGALDVLARWSDAPRYGFLSSFGPEIDAERIAAAAKSLRRFHINVVQFYDWMWRHYKLLPPQDEFTDALGRPTSLRAVRDSVAAVQEMNAAAMAYGAVYGAEPEYADERPELVLRDKNGERIHLAELFYIMDIAPKSPWTPLIVNEFAETVRELDFDGIHLDQYGFPKGTVWVQSGEERDLSRDFPPLIDAARAAVVAEKPSAGVIFNAVENWPIAKVAPTSQDAIYIEVWPPDVEYNDLRRLIQEGKRLGRGQQLILAAYLTPFLESPSAPESEAAALLATAAISSSGGFHLLLGERNGILCDPYYPKFGTLRNEFLPILQSYYDYLVRYEEWLTMSSVTDWNVCIGGESIANDAKPGMIWAIARQTPDAKIVHLIDLRNQTETLWNAPRAPWRDGGERVLVEIPIADRVTGALIASPDANHGKAAELAFTQSGDLLKIHAPISGPWTTLVLQTSH